MILGLSVNDNVIYNKEIKTFFLSVRTFADSVSKTKSFRLNQQKGWMRLIFVFLFLEESVWGRAERVVVFCFQKYIYFWELHVSGNYKRLDLTS